ncbi:MAG: hypothetical protein LW701_01815 [Fluviicola sp.]|jgi:hypothetical protein|nr:hypothetical protein [Fluviicola sp.]
MKIVYGEKSYMSGGDNHLMEDGYDYMLFRQDWNGSEKIYFNKGDIDHIYEKINEGTILIHRNYSILYCKNDELFNEIEDLGCFSMVVD